jgi:hypothetical protein
MKDVFRLIGYFIQGLIIGCLIHFIGEKFSVPILPRLFIAILATELLFQPPKEPLEDADTYFRIGIFYAQAPLVFMVAS